MIKQQLGQVGLDIFTTMASWLLVLVVLPITPTDVRPDAAGIAMAVVTTLVTVALFARLSLYAALPSLPRTDEVAGLFGATLMGSAGLAIFASFTNFALGARELLLGGFLTVLCRSLTRGVFRHVDAATASARSNVVVVGAGEEAADLCRLVTDHPESHLRLLGLVGDREVAGRFDLGALWLGPTDKLVEIMHLHGAQTAIVTPTGFRSESLNLITERLAQVDIAVFMSNGVTRLNPGRISARSLVHEPLLLFEQFEAGRWQRQTKRIMDLVLASVALVVAAPLFLLIAAAIKMESRGTIFYRSERYGRNAEPFAMLKFRSMVRDADALKEGLTDLNQRSGPIFKIDDDPRITRVGRFIRETSLDELPQFLNVLRGDMSVVGPRPALPDEEAAFEGEHRKRFRVRPGITGLWQVEARSNPNFNAYRRLDLHYLENWTVRLDLKILLATAEQIVVDVLTLPVRHLFGLGSVDGVRAADDEVVIDLRTETRRRFGGDDFAITEPAGDTSTEHQG